MANNERTHRRRERDEGEGVKGFFKYLGEWKSMDGGYTWGDFIGIILLITAFIFLIIMP
jgi:hypothetical protein